MGKFESALIYSSRYNILAQYQNNAFCADTYILKRKLKKNGDSAEENTETDRQTDRHYLRPGESKRIRDLNLQCDLIICPNIFKKNYGY